MKELQELTSINFYSLFVSVVSILIAMKAFAQLFEWFIHKLGLETKWMRQQNEEHALLLQTSEKLSQLQKKHEESVKQSMMQDKQIKEDLSMLMDDVKKMVERNPDKENQIENIMAAQREVLADKINEKYKYYISIQGIPEDEVEEFTNLHIAYKGVGGNHSGDAKYEYCMNHLSVVPVETKLIQEQG